MQFYEPVRPLTPAETHRCLQLLEFMTEWWNDNELMRGPIQSKFGRVEFVPMRSYRRGYSMSLVLDGRVMIVFRTRRWRAWASKSFLRNFLPAEKCIKVEMYRLKKPDLH